MTGRRSSVTSSPIATTPSTVTRPSRTRMRTSARLPDNRNLGRPKADAMRAGSRVARTQRKTRGENPLGAPLCERCDAPRRCRLYGEHRRPGRLAVVEITMRLGGILQRIALIDLDLDGAA